MEALAVGEIRQTLLQRAWRSGIDPKRTGSFINRIVPDLYNPKPQAWVRVDELLKIDEEGPKLITVVRVSENRPKYPMSSRLGETIEKFKAAMAGLAPAPNHLPTR